MPQVLKQKGECCLMLNIQRKKTKSKKQFQLKYEIYILLSFETPLFKTPLPPPADVINTSSFFVFSFAVTMLLSKLELLLHNDPNRLSPENQKNKYTKLGNSFKAFRVFFSAASLQQWWQTFCNGRKNWRPYYLLNGQMNGIEYTVHFFEFILNFFRPTVIRLFRYLFLFRIWNTELD